MVNVCVRGMVTVEPQTGSDATAYILITAQEWLRYSLDSGLFIGKYASLCTGANIPSKVTQLLHLKYTMEAGYVASFSFLLRYYTCTLPIWSGSS